MANNDISVHGVVRTSKDLIRQVPMSKNCPAHWIRTITFTDRDGSDTTINLFATSREALDVPMPTHTPAATVAGPDLVVADDCDDGDDDSIKKEEEQALYGPDGL